jgi:sugar-specific transcriptional regulator TrmB
LVVLLVDEQLDNAKFFPMKVDRVKFQLTNIGLNEYQASALSHLLYLGETKVMTLSKASGVPVARVYGILDELSQRGLVTVRPGRPVLYSPMTPDDITHTLTSEAREEARTRLELVQKYCDEFLVSANEIYLKAGDVNVQMQLLRLVGVGDVSMTETKKLYLSAQESLSIMTQAMEYFDEVEAELKEVLEKGVKVRILMMSDENMEGENRTIRNEMIARMRVSLGNSAEVRLTREVNIRGCIVDPDSEGKALFLVPEHGVPYFLREAAITSHPGVVKGLFSMFDLLWRLDSQSPDMD